MKHSRKTNRHRRIFDAVVATIMAGALVLFFIPTIVLTETASAPSAGTAVVETPAVEAETSGSETGGADADNVGKADTTASDAVQGAQTSEDATATATAKKPITSLPKKGTYETHSLIVKTEANTSVAAATDGADVDAEECTVLFTGSDGARIISVPVAGTGTMLATANALNDDPDVASTTFNYYLNATSSSSKPNDTYYRRGSQWALNGRYGIGAPAAWGKKAYGSRKTAIVVVVDSGINTKHEDLKGRLWSNPYTDIKTSYAVGSTGKYRTATPKKGACGFDYANGDSSPVDDAGHGTHVSGIIAAAGNNKKGVTGVCQNVKVMALKVLNKKGQGSFENAILAYGYIYKVMQKNDPKNQIVAINNSYGMLLSAYQYSSYSQMFSNFNYVFDQVGALGAVTVTAAGNEHTCLDGNLGSSAWYGGTHLSIPGCCTSSYNLCVAATKSNGLLDTSYTNYGSGYGTKHVDVAAPGTSILSTYIGGTKKYKKLSGTSMATPMVAGAAALLYTTLLNDGGSVSATSANFVESVLKSYGIYFSNTSLAPYVANGGIVNMTNMITKLIITCKDAKGATVKTITRPYVRGATYTIAAPKVTDYINASPTSARFAANAGTVKLTFTYTANKKHSITYAGVKTTKAYPTSYRDASSTTSIPNPTKTGYTFLGWTVAKKGSTKALATGVVSLKVGAGTVYTGKDLLLTAKWKSLVVKTSATQVESNA